MNSQPNRIVALLPMKANSTRVKGKNFRNLYGKPLFRWVLDTLLEEERINQIVINTDARDILADNNLVDSGKILIRDRRPEICGDDVSMNLVIADDLANVHADLYLMTHTTNPFLSPITIRRGIEIAKNNIHNSAFDSLFTVNKLQTRFYLGNGSPINHDPANLIPTQDLEPWYEENSNMFIFTKSSFESTNARIGKRPYLLEQCKYESIDIDTEDDWHYAALLAQSLAGATRRP